MKIKLKGIFNHRSYEIEELSILLHKNGKTIFRWIGDGLKIVPESKKPILIMGSDLKEFIKKKNSKKKKVKLTSCQFYCLSCKKGVRGKRGSSEKKDNRKTALCSVCNGRVSRIFKPYRKGL